ncbi:MAG: fibronectin type III domain-containing protein [Candidatus Shapirobacteria bacterium]|nr:fibronectin type III domain-containing protein [Candidatus Shapirobacteria bacterium]
MKKIRRLPTVLGLLLVLGAIATGVILIKQGPTLFLKASPALTPNQMKVTNIGESSFTVSWLTDQATSSFIKYGTDNSLTFTAADDRDQLSGKTGEFSTHHVTVKNLKPSTNYFFKIGSGGKIFDNNGQPYQLTTSSASKGSPPPNDVAYGTVVDQNSNPVEGAIVYLSLANANPASTLTKSSGSWVIPLNLVRSADLSFWASYDKGASIEEIFVQAGSIGTATVVATTKNDSPMPKIILGQNFDFRKVAEEKPQTQTGLTPTPEATETSKFAVEPIATPSAATSSAQVKILNPEQDEKINTPKPEFLGTGPVGTTLTINVQSSATYSGTVKVDSKGDWQWIPPANLEPGEHTITATYKDKNGLLQKITRAFVVLASGESGLPAMTATPSGSATPSPTPTSKVATASPTPISTTSGRTSMPSTTSGIPSSGYLTPTFIVFIMGFSLIFLGLFIKKLVRF